MAEATPVHFCSVPSPAVIFSAIDVDWSMRNKKQEGLLALISDWYGMIEGPPEEPLVTAPAAL
jgi:hypothetical protein